GATLLEGLPCWRGYPAGGATLLEGLPCWRGYPAGGATLLEGLPCWRGYPAGGATLLVNKSRSVFMFSSGPLPRSFAFGTIMVLELAPFMVIGRDEPRDNQ
ncbi:hypothetical protein Vretimale_2795, partial [Volvox reticuliferus]